MSRAPKIKIVAARMLAPKAARAFGVGTRRAFPAWIDSAEGGLAFAPTAVTPRVRDSLVLRMVGRVKQSASPRKTVHGSGAR